MPLCGVELTFCLFGVRGVLSAWVGVMVGLLGVGW